MDERLETSPLDGSRDLRHLPGRRRRRSRLELLYPLGLVAATLIGWHLWVTVGDAPPYLWPSLGDVARIIAESGELHRAVLDTLILIAIGFALAIVLGLTIAALTASSRLFEVGVFPIVVSTQFVPLIALAPLFIVWWGFDMKPKLIIIMLFGYFPIVITALAGLRSLEIEKMYLAQAMGAGGLSAFARVRLPNALPSTFAGLKIAVTSCVIGAVVAEFIVGSSGVGYVILRAQGIGDSATVVAGVILLALIGALGFGLVSLAERLAIPWHSSQLARDGG